MTYVHLRLIKEKDNTDLLEFGTRKVDDTAAFESGMGDSGDESDESTTRTTRKRSAMSLSVDELRDVFRPSEDELEQSRRGVRAQQVMARAAKKQARAKKTGVNQEFLLGLLAHRDKLSADEAGALDAGLAKAIRAAAAAAGASDSDSEAEDEGGEQQPRRRQESQDAVTGVQQAIFTRAGCS